MRRERLTVGRVLGLVGSYLWALGMAFLGTILGQFLVLLVVALAYGVVTRGEGVQAMLAAFVDADLAGIGLSANGYSTSLESVLYTSAQYLMDIGIWVVVLVYLRISRKARPILGAVTRRTAGNVPSALGVGLVAGLAMNGLCGLVAVLTGSVRLSLVGVNVGGLVLTLACVFVQSSAEELLCRCYLYQRTLRTLGSPSAAVLVTAAAFGLMHLANPGVTLLSVANVTLVGVLFGLMVWRLDSPWMAFAAHTGWNFMQAVVLGLPNSGTTTPFALLGIAPGTTPASGIAYDAGFGIEGSAMATVVLAVACVVVWVVGSRRHVEPTDLWAGQDARDGKRFPADPRHMA